MHTTASSPAAGSPATGSPAALKYLWISVGALGACVLALGGTLLAQKLPGDAPQAAPAAPQVIEEKAPPALARQAQSAPDSRANRVLPVAQAPAPFCASCGRVESVQPVAQAAPATGVGAVAGGGSGRTAATVLGAVGGGYVGHQVEQRTRTTTVYQMRVRMDDGSLRTFTRAQPVAEGTPVRVEGKGFRVDDRAAAGAQPVYVSDRNY